MACEKNWMTKHATLSILYHGISLLSELSHSKESKLMRLYHFAYVILILTVITLNLEHIVHEMTYHTRYEMRGGYRG